jgi:hypothetical protein
MTGAFNPAVITYQQTVFSLRYTADRVDTFDFLALTDHLRIFNSKESSFLRDHSPTF